MSWTHETSSVKVDPARKAARETKDQTDSGKAARLETGREPVPNSHPGRFGTPGRPEGHRRRPHMKALVLNALGRGFDFEDVDIAAPMGREVLVEVRASGQCHTDLLFATHDFVPTP